MKNDREEFKNKFKRRIYEWVIRLIKRIDELPRNSSDSVIGKQLLRSGTSVLANYIEAQAASSKKDFANFFRYSFKSANESKMWIALLRDTGKFEKEEAGWLLKELIEISNILGSSLITLKKQAKK